MAEIKTRRKHRRLAVGDWNDAKTMQVVEVLPTLPGKSYRNVQVRAICKCGGEWRGPSNDFRRRQACGNLTAHPQAPKRPARPGDRIGSVVLVARVGQDAHGDARWLVRCDCGRYAERRLDNLRRDGDRATCGGPKHRRAAVDDLTYNGAHWRVRRERGSASDYVCAVSGCVELADEWAFTGPTDGPNVRYELHEDARHPEDSASRWREAPYSGDPADYSPLCHGCHTAIDQHDIPLTIGPAVRLAGEEAA